MNLGRIWSTMTLRFDWYLGCNSKTEANQSQSLEAWDQYDSTLTQPHPEILPRLVSSMSNEQWIDAISAPRDDPTRFTERAMDLPKKTRKARKRGRNPGTQDMGNGEQSKKGLGDVEAGTEQADQNLPMDIDSSDIESDPEGRQGDDDIEKSDEG